MAVCLQSTRQCVRWKHMTWTVQKRHHVLALHRVWAAREYGAFWCLAFATELPSKFVARGPLDLPTKTFLVSPHDVCGIEMPLKFENLCIFGVHFSQTTEDPTASMMRNVPGSTPVTPGTATRSADTWSKDSGWCGLCACFSDN